MCELIIAIDIGSSSVRCTAYNTATNPPTLTPYSSKITSEPFDDNGQYDADVLTDSVEKALKTCIQQMPLNYHIVALGFDCFAMSFVGSNSSNQAITKVFSYAERSASTATYTTKLKQRLLRQNGIESTYQRTGAPIHSAYAGPTLMRLLQEEPKVFNQVTCWQSFTSHLLQRWTDPLHHPIPVSYSEASWTGLYNRLDKCWDNKLLYTIGMNAALQQKLAPVIDYDGLPSDLRLSTDMLSIFPRLSKARLFLGFGDGAMANIGSKCTDLTRIAVTIGTSAALRVVVPSNSVTEIPLGLWCYAVDGQHSLLGGALTDGGSIHAFLNQILKEEDTIDKEKKKNNNKKDYVVGDHGLIVLPFLSGERSPGWNNNACGTIHGLTRNTTKSDIQKAMYESVCLRLKSVMNLISPFLDPNAVVLASGTALKSNPEWKQMMADALGRDLYVEKSSEATSRGVALMVLKSLRKKEQEIKKEQLDVSVEIFQSLKENDYDTWDMELIKQQEMYRKMYGKDGTVGNVRAMGAAVVCGVVLGCVLSYFRPRV